MLRMLMLFVVLALAAPAAAQRFYETAPISIENAVLMTPDDPEGVFVSPPITKTFDLSHARGCAQHTLLLDVRVVDDVLEVEYSGAAISDDSDLGCEALARLRFDLVLDVPVVGDHPASFVYLAGERGKGDFEELRSASLRLQKNGPSRSLHVGAPVATPFQLEGFVWGEPEVEEISEPAAFATLPAGDRIRVPFELSVSMTGANDARGDTEGALSARFEFRTLRNPVSAATSSPSFPTAG